MLAKTSLKIFAEYLWTTLLTIINQYCAGRKPMPNLKKMITHHALSTHTNTVWIFIRTASPIMGQLFHISYIPCFFGLAVKVTSFIGCITGRELTACISVTQERWTKTVLNSRHITQGHCLIEYNNKNTHVKSSQPQNITEINFLWKGIAEVSLRSNCPLQLQRGTESDVGNWWMVE